MDYRRRRLFRTPDPSLLAWLAFAAEWVFLLLLAVLVGFLALFLAPAMAADGDPGSLAEVDWPAVFAAVGVLNTQFGWVFSGVLAAAVGLPAGLGLFLYRAAAVGGALKRFVQDHPEANDVLASLAERRGNRTAARIIRALPAADTGRG